jgi:hypothetical protein
MLQRSPFSEKDLRAAIAKALCWADALRFLGFEVKGANYRTLQRHVRRWGISTDHFDQDAGRKRAGLAQQIPLEQVLVKDSTYARGKLKRRLLATGLKQPICELCGQDETWNGRRMSLILDHINGVADDHRLENLRMVCPNCAATLETHCGRNTPRTRICPGCDSVRASERSASILLSRLRVAAHAYRGKSHPETRKVPRPSYGQLMTDLKSMSMLAVGRKYGVSDNAVRKWIRWYEYQREMKRRQDEAA